MSRTITNINANTETFQIWLDRTNQALDVLEETVTLKANTAGDITSGNGFVVGILGANTITATQIRGGNVTSSDYITFITNTNIAASQANVVANVYMQGANLTFNSNSSITAIKVASNGTSTNTTVGGTNFRVTANTRFDTNITLVGSLDVTGTITGDITLTGNAIYTTATIFNANVEFQDEVTGNVNFDSGTLFVDSVNNRVGIGTTSPLSDLHVYGSLVLDNDNADGPQLALASLGYDTYYIDNFSGDLRFYNGGTERVKIDASGNVGIGNTAPAHKLRVEGTTSITGTSSLSNTTIAGANLYVTSTNTAISSNVTLSGSSVKVDNTLTVNTVTFASGNSITNYTVSTSAPTGGSDGDVWVVIPA
jgi:hypothetical protein